VPKQCIHMWVNVKMIKNKIINGHTWCYWCDENIQKLIYGDGCKTP
jgi:hypothetical protein